MCVNAFISFQLLKLGKKLKWKSMCARPYSSWAFNLDLVGALQERISFMQSWYICFLLSYPSLPISSHSDLFEKSITFWNEKLEIPVAISPTLLSFNLCNFKTYVCVCVHTYTSLHARSRACKRHFLNHDVLRATYTF